MQGTLLYLVIFAVYAVLGMVYSGIHVRFKKHGRSLFIPYGFLFLIYMSISPVIALLSYRPGEKVHPNFTLIFVGIVAVIFGAMGYPLLFEGKTENREVE